MDPDPSGNILVQIVLLIVLIALNAFFAAGEIALISLNETKMEKSAEDGDKKAKKICKLLQNSSRFLATIQIGVTLAGFLASATAAGYLAEPLAKWVLKLAPSLTAHAAAVETVSLVLITLIISYFSLVFGELVPKRIAMAKAEKLAFAMAGILTACSVIFAPFVKLLALSTNGVLRLFGIDPHADDDPVTEEEIRLMVDEGEDAGIIEESQRDMLENVFEFDDVDAEDLMTPRIDVAALDVTESIADAIDECMQKGYSRLPVYEEDIDHIIGVLYVKDLLPYVGKELPSSVTLKSLCRETLFVPATVKGSALFQQMSEKHLQMAIVIDEYGGTAGIVTVEDLLESIVGNMQDEFDHESEELEQTGDNAFEADGALDVEELSEQLDVEFPEGDYDTLAGFLLSELGHIPEVGEQVTFENVTFTVTEMDDRRIETVHIDVTPTE
ncbi:MAG: hemolysin family protein, partial [Clostridia bacterium]|nr:hemolysin family protein [Clostridia bacterium]